MFQVTIEINTNLPKKEPKADGDKGKSEDDKDAKQTTQSFEFKIPAELLQ